MIFIQAATSTTISDAIYQADVRSRRDLEKGLIAGEDDYVSTLVTRIRDASLPAWLRVHAHSRVLRPGEEQRFGSDAMIVFVSNATAKVCLFEAKWPRASRPNFRWDYYQQSSRVSHFATQLLRQSSWSGPIAIWELFLVELPSTTRLPGFDSSGSTCIWHDDALRYDQGSRTASLWHTSDVHDLVQPPASNGHSLASIIRTVLRCGKGSRHSLVRGNIRLAPTKIDTAISIPVSGDQLESRIDRFCEEYGLRGLLIISAP
jgi:hypothetical protein